tara:strand:- start:6692 stop:6931 length:240 start_codon:yes stop_codon:yes gene_type:complete
MRDTVMDTKLGRILASQILKEDRKTLKRGDTCRILGTNKVGFVYAIMPDGVLFFDEKKNAVEPQTYASWQVKKEDKEID